MSFWQQHGDEISAAITLMIAGAAAFAVDRWVIAHGSRVAARVSGVTELSASRTAQTRLRVIRRLVVVIIMAIGVALALSQFTRLDKLATGILASSAVVGLVLGFAARQSLANMVAGILIAVTQPIRIGDTVSFAEATGRVDDLTLSYTYIDTGDGRLMVVPNERVAASVLFNHSTGDRSAPAIVSVWVPPDANLQQARVALGGAGAAEAHVVEMTAEGVRIEIRGPRERDRTKAGDEEAELRERAHEALRSAGLLGFAS